MQQPVDRFEPKASLASQCRGVELSTFPGIGSGKSDADFLSCPGKRTVNRRMLPAGHFTFPPSVRTGVASDGIIESTAPTHRAVAQHHHVSVVGFHAVLKPCG